MPNHLNAFPCLMPWTGDNYDSRGHSRLLVIGESHYFPPKSTIHLNASDWYSELGMKDLPPDEIEFISTADIVDDAIRTDFGIQSYGIFREVSGILSLELGLPAINDGLTHSMFMNFFQRPAQHVGESIKEEDLDVEVALDALEWVVEEYKPNLVAIVSSKAGSYASRILSEKSVPFCITPHPTCAWWNRRAATYGDRYGREILPDFLRDNEWVR